VKERLTGAIILVVLIVLLVPELLTGPIRPAPRTVAVASSAEEPPYRSYTIKLADEPHARGGAAHSAPEQPAPLPAAPPAPAATAAPTAAEEPMSSSPPPAVTQPAAHSAPATGAAAAPAATAQGSGSYAVQLGSFASRANADRLARQVHAQGFAVSVSKGTSGHLYRVRVGPARDRAAASELAQQLHARGHSGEIVRE
jgi:cell division septation protein DedD